MNTKPLQKNIPDDWQVKKLGDLGRVSMCKRILKSQTSEDGDIPFFKIGTFGKEPDAYISKEVYEDFKSKYSFPKRGDILISASGTIGRTVVYDGRPAYYQDSNIIWIANDENTVINPYLRYLYDKVRWQTASGTIARLYNDNVRRIEIVAPEIPEQKRIVKVLETWDEAIEKLGDMIALKREVKKGLMQKLLTGDLRLSGFEGDWHEVSLDDIATFNPSEKHLPEEFFYIDLESVKRGVLVKKQNIKLASAPSRAQRLLKEGDILFQTVRPYQKNNLLFNESGSFVASTGYAQIRALQSTNFLYHFLHADFFVSKVLARCTGSNYPAINSKDLSKIIIKIPPSIEEQDEIGDILASSDAEIQKLLLKRNLLQDQKKYLLNNLVTGQIRTPENL